VKKAMDLLDQISLGALLILVAALFGMLLQQHLRSSGIPATSEVEASSSDLYELERQMDQRLFYKALDLEKAGQVDQAIIALQDVMNAHPQRPSVYLYMARLYLEAGSLVDSVHYYRLAVEKNPDYVDKRTPVYCGDELKALVTEGLEKLSREKVLRPKDRQVRSALKDIYYLQSRLAGGCE